MRRLLSLAAAGAVVVLSACADAPEATSPDVELGAERSRAARYVVVLNDDVTDIRGVSAEIARGNAFGLERIRTHAARGFTAVIPDARIEAVRMDPRVKIVERDYIVSLIEPVRPSAPPPGRGPGGGGGGGGGGGDDTVPWGITRVNGGATPYTGSRAAWVLDTGVDQDHPDLNIDPACSVSFAGGDPDDKNGHGTHVAGTIGAIKGNGGVVGVAPGVKICAVKVLGNGGSGSYADIVDGIDHVAENGSSGDVANMSLGGSGSNSTMENAIRDAAGAGIRFVLAAGNSGANANNYTPARVNGTNIYTISAIDSRDRFASFSNYGNPPVDYAAPGVSVYSTYKGGGYATLSGTSMAAPHVAGILILGAIRTDGTAIDDPDGNRDPIAVH